MTAGANSLIQNVVVVRHLIWFQL